MQIGTNGLQSKGMRFGGQGLVVGQGLYRRPKVDLEIWHHSRPQWVE